MLVSRGECYKAIVYKRKENSAEISEVPAFSFMCRPASNLEKKQYISDGLITKNDSLMLYATRIDGEIKNGDQILFNGEMKIVESVGYYLNKTRNIGAYAFRSEEIIKNAPKGITLN
jgi:hypothetical protein